ncbi:WD repeat-containing protein, putative [Plasmodium ovale curtisi]|uniref:WD repeat-containing protein, putative n=1 Tax=Plasmodium ovale curtisi TaxID=864141 RepID=A0A1A8WG30_PLAOA|nr:WD repeat-containing protein, putative [Plasmodium ovale curtisi]
MLNKRNTKKRQRPKDLNSLDCSKKIENISEEEKKYIYPNVNENSKHFLTTGDDKIIIIYDDDWNVRYKIVHKKKIVKAYFLKCGDGQIEKNEILFIDKYGDVYLCNTQLLLKDGALKDNNLSESNTNNDQTCKKENNDTSPDGSITIKLNYLIDSLNDIEIKDEDLFFMKDFEHILENTYDNSDESYNIENEIDINNDIDVKENKNSEEKLDEPNDNNKINVLNGHENKINKIKERLEKHYQECFNNQHYLHPIITCSSGVVSLYYDSMHLFFFFCNILNFKTNM